MQGTYKATITDYGFMIKKSGGVNAILSFTTTDGQVYSKIIGVKQKDDPNLSYFIKDMERCGADNPSNFIRLQEGPDSGYLDTKKELEIVVEGYTDDKGETKYSVKYINDSNKVSGDELKSELEKLGYFQNQTQVRQAQAVNLDEIPF